MRPCLMVLMMLLTIGAAHAAPPGGTLRFELQRQLPVIQVQIDGAPASLLVDLGGALALALRPDWPGWAPDETQDARRVAFAGGWREELVARPWRKAVIPPGIDGYLGYGYLQRFGVVIDYAVQEVRLVAAGEPLTACRSAPVALKRLGSLPYLGFERDGQPLRLGLDTGANQNVLKRSAVNAGATEARVTLGAVQLDGRAVDLGAFRLLELPIPVVDGLLGYDFFARHRVCMEAAARAVAFDEYAAEK